MRFLRRLMKRKARRAMRPRPRKAPTTPAAMTAGRLLSVEAPDSCLMLLGCGEMEFIADASGIATLVPSNSGEGVGASEKAEAVTTGWVTNAGLTGGSLGSGAGSEATSGVACTGDGSPSEGGPSVGAKPDTGSTEGLLPTTLGLSH